MFVLVVNDRVPEEVAVALRVAASALNDRVCRAPTQAPAEPVLRSVLPVVHEDFFHGFLAFSSISLKSVYLSALGAEIYTHFTEHEYI